MCAVESLETGVGEASRSSEQWRTRCSTLTSQETFIFPAMFLASSPSRRSSRPSSALPSFSLSSSGSSQVFSPPFFLINSLENSICTPSVCWNSATKEKVHLCLFLCDSLSKLTTFCLLCWFSGRFHKISKLDRLLMCWWAFTGLTHMILEGYFAFSPEFYKEKTSFFLAEVCMSFLFLSLVFLLYRLWSLLITL